MKIKKESDNVIEIHKKRDGTIRKSEEGKINDKKVTTRAKRTAGAITLIGERAIAEHVEGGEEIERSLYIAQIASKPARNTTKALGNLGSKIRKQRKENTTVQKQVERKIRKVAKNKARSTAKGIVKKASREVVKDGTKETVKTATKATAKVSTTVAGSTVGPSGTVIDIAVGEVAGEAIDKLDYAHKQKMRKVKLFLDKLQSQEKQKDNIFILAKDTIKNFTMHYGK